MSEKPNDINGLGHVADLAEAFAQFRRSKGAEGLPKAESNAEADAEESEGASPLPNEALPPPAEAPATPLVAIESVPEAPLADSFMRVRAAKGADVLDAYIASRVSLHSKRTMRAGLERVARLLGAPITTIPWHELRFEHTDAIRAKLLERSPSKATVTVTLAALKGVLRHAKRMGLLSKDAFDNATDWGRLELDDLPAGREVTQEEIEKIQRYIASFEGAPYGAFLEAAFALMLGTGLRAIEVSRATVAAYSKAEKTIRVLRKGGKQQDLPLGDPECLALDAWLEHRKAFERRIQSPALLLRVQPNDWVRPKTPECNEQALIHLCKRVAEQAGVESFTPHDLRRSFCTRAIRVSNDDFAVQTLMGHRKIETTRRYDKRKIEEHGVKRRTWNIWRPALKVDEAKKPGS